MLEYYLTGTNARGRRKTIRVRAASAYDAVEVAGTQDYCDVTLHTDDVAAIAVSSMAKSRFNFFSPREVVQARTLSDWGFFVLLAKKLYFILAVFFLLEACMWALENELLPPLASNLEFYIFLLLSPVLLSALVVYLGPRRKFNALVKAACWGRWEEVLSRIASLRGIVPDFELDIRTACALSGQGRFEEALALCEKHAESETVPSWIYLVRLSGVYQVAHRYTEALECIRLAYEKNSDDPIAALDLAMASLEGESDTAHAEKLIEFVEKATISDLTMLHLPYVKGLLALNTKKYEEAEEFFYTAAQRLFPFAVEAPLFNLIYDKVIAYRAIALAAQGKKAEASELFSTVTRRFEARPDLRLLTRYKRALAQ